MLHNIEYTRKYNYIGWPQNAFPVLQWHLLPLTFFLEPISIFSPTKPDPSSPPLSFPLSLPPAFILILPSVATYHSFTQKPSVYNFFFQTHTPCSIDMELSELVDRTAKISCLDIRLELPPNQASPCKSQNNLLGKLISSKVIGFNTVRDVVGKAWRPSFPLEVKRLEGNLFLFSFHHEADLLKAFRRRPWSIRGGHLILKKWSSDLAWK